LEEQIITYTHIQQRWQIYTELARFEVDTKEVQVHTEEYNFTCYNSEGRTKFASEFMCHTHTHSCPSRCDTT